MRKFGMVIALPLFVSACMTTGENNSPNSDEITAIRAEMEALKVVVENHRVELDEANRQRQNDDTELHAELANLEKKLAGKQDDLDGKFELKLDKLGQRIEAKVYNLEVKLEDIEEKFDAELINIEGKFEGNLGRTSKQLDELEGKYKDHTHRHKDTQ